MGRIGGVSDRVWPLYEKIPTLLTCQPSERVQMVEDGSLLTLRCVISDAKFLTSRGTELQKPDFLYGDAIADRGQHDEL